MRFRNTLSMAALCLFALTTGAATIVVPAAGTGPGANGSQWQTELTLHSAAPRAVSALVSFHQGTNVLGPVTVTLTPRQTLSIADIAKTKFNLDSANGALVIEIADRDARHLAVASRTTNHSAAGEFGQDVPAVKIADAASAGDIATIPGPSDATTSRFNFGIYAVNATNVTWQLVRADGTIAKTKDASYAAGEAALYGFGTSTFLGTEAKNNDTVYARVTSGNAIFYGSSINSTGDPTFIPATRTRDDIHINLLGVDLNQDGTIDIADADGDGRLDGTLEIANMGFPNFFRLFATGEFGESVQFEIVSSPGDATVDAQGNLVAAGDARLAGTTSQIVVRATVGTSTTLFTIPVRFR
jgi:hypothetical protein